MHNRIRNHFATVPDLLTLQSKTLTDPTAVAALMDARSRLQGLPPCLSTTKPPGRDGEAEKSAKAAAGIKKRKQRIAMDLKK